MPSSHSNRAVLGERVYAFDAQQYGTVQHVNALNIRYAPVVLLEDGTRKMYCGTSLPQMCQHIPLFADTMRDQGEGTDAIAQFQSAWFAHADRETQRQALYDGLVAAKADGTVAEYLASVKTTLHL